MEVEVRVGNTNTSTDVKLEKQMPIRKLSCKLELSNYVASAGTVSQRALDYDFPGLFVIMGFRFVRSRCFGIRNK